MDLLLELEPDGLIAASATMRLPARAWRRGQGAQGRGLDRRASWSPRSTPRRSPTPGLVKSRRPARRLRGADGGDDRRADRGHAATPRRRPRRTGVGAPKAIYVCKTNIVEGNACRWTTRSSRSTQRRSPPILIWRYLTEHCDVDPGESPSTAPLKTHKDFPLPAGLPPLQGRRQGLRGLHRRATSGT